MDNELRFAAGLYQGTADYYDSYRLPYPDTMIEYVVGQAIVDGQGRLLDLACGTGQLTFPLRWLKPGGCVALCWSDGPQAGDEEWQRAFADEGGNHG